MIRRGLICAGLMAALAALSACAGQGPQEPDLLAMVEDPDFKPRYQGIETTLLDGDLVQFNVAMKGARNKQDVSN